MTIWNTVCSVFSAGKELALLKRLRGGGEFCSEAHRKEYQEQYEQLALARLLQAKPPAESASLGRTPFNPPDPRLGNPYADVPASVATFDVSEDGPDATDPVMEQQPAAWQPIDPPVVHQSRRRVRSRANGGIHGGTGCARCNAIRPSRSSSN